MEHATLKLHALTAPTGPPLIALIHRGKQAIADAEMLVQAFIVQAARGDSIGPKRLRPLNFRMIRQPPSSFRNNAAPAPSAFSLPSAT